MAAKGRAYHSEEFSVGQMPAVDLSQSREPDVILVPDVNLKQGELEELAFNEEVVTIRVDRFANSVEATNVPVSVNGETVHIPIGIPVKLKRKFVGVLAMSKNTDIKTGRANPNDFESNRVFRHTFLRFPFSVISDPNPRGHDWLTKLLAA